MPLNPKSLKTINEKLQNFNHTLDVKKTKTKMPQI